MTMVSLRNVFMAAATLVLSAAVPIMANAQETIKVGAIVAQSPPGSVVQGTQVTHGLEIARDMINEDGGVLGRQIEVLFEDGQGVPERGRAAAEKLITSDEVVAITGEHQSSNVLAEIEVANRYNVLYINTNGWSDDIRLKGYPQVFNPANYNSRVSDAMAQVIAALGVDSVVAFAENTDYGIGQAMLLGDFLKQNAPDVDYSYETLDRAAKDYMPAILPLRQSPPDMVVNILLPPGAYILMNQLHEQGVAPTEETLLYDGAGLADYPDFWDNVGDAAVNMIEFGLYHPSMEMPELADRVAQAYRERHDGEPNRLIFQAADSLFLIAEAIKRAESTETDAMIEALRNIEWIGTRGTITFNTEEGNTFQQWVEVPYVTYQLTERGQPVADAPLIQSPSMELDPSNVQRGGN
jgi:branched-chain amino acid transport system substrate-binding protein